MWEEQAGAGLCSNFPSAPQQWHDFGGNFNLSEVQFPVIINDRVILKSQDYYEDQVSGQFLTQNRNSVTINSLSSFFLLVHCTHLYSNIKAFYFFLTSMTSYSNGASATRLEENYHDEVSCGLNLFGTFLKLPRNLLVPEPLLRAPALPQRMSQQDNLKLA